MSFGSSSGGGLDPDALIFAGKYDEALQALNRSSGSDDLRLAGKRCYCLTQIGRHDEAIGMLQKHLSSRRGWSAGWIAKAKVHFDLGQYAQALDCLTDDGTKNLKKGSSRAIMEEARDLRACIGQVRDSGATEHIRGNVQYKAEEFERATKHYLRAVEELPSMEDRSLGEQERERLGALHSNLSACYFKLGHAEVSKSKEMWFLALKHALKCVKLRPGWSKGYTRRDDAIRVLDVSKVDVSAIEESLHKTLRVSETKAGVEEDNKVSGDNAFKRGDFSSAVNFYTKALQSNQVHHPKAKLHSNRSACYAKLGKWVPALEDGQKALQESPRWHKAWMRVACAMEGLGNVLDAYCVYSKALGSCAEGKAELQRSMAALLPLIPVRDTHVSLDCRGSRCLERFQMDANFPRDRTRVFCISDVHIDQHGNIAWFKKLSDENFTNDVVIIAGDVGDTMNALRICLKEFKKRFRRVFFTPGNHDLWIRRDTSDGKMYPDSIAKMGAMHNVCQELGVDMGPAEVAQGIFVVPLFSWYNHTFDERDPTPGGLRYDSFCQWPPSLGGHLEVWKYFLLMNRERVGRDYKGGYKGPGTPYVFSMSHFLPRAELPYPMGVQEMAKAVGCKELDVQIQRIKSDVHVFGHTHMDMDTTMPGTDTRYVQSALDGGGGLYKLYEGHHLTGTRVDTNGFPI
ncbi:putative metallophosphatase [Chloropicon primus]|uniref:Putative metallophosphatase n=1 Tax=Chloropicon primus TaxID=1764295 RepID=A0A5B8MYF0_9CHLO|nr:putative metallophosphatase [Chloropicon primus]UPR05013.1 putative metallophosphatase [Chloropicon primus]|eukprot:QDZ25818.1 putative metallophosphatase [Chloropicon primus]